MSANRRPANQKAAVLTGRARIKQSVWGNWNGYVGARKVREFGTDGEAAASWLDYYTKHPGALLQLKAWNNQTEPADPIPSVAPLPAVYVKLTHCEVVDWFQWQGRSHIAVASVEDKDWAAGLFGEIGGIESEEEARLFARALCDAPIVLEQLRRATVQLDAIYELCKRVNLFTVSVPMWQEQYERRELLQRIGVVR